MQQLFNFDPARYASAFAANDYVHIREGLSEQYHEVLCRQIEQRFQATVLKNFALGDKQQSLYEFPSDAHLSAFRQGIGAVCGFDPDRLVISERHIKAYEADADPYPKAHKDRFATELAVGFSVRVPAGSTLVLYLDTDRGVNPFNSSAELRDSLPPERLPESVLRGAPRLEICDRPRDVVIFRGRDIWHLRERAANTVMLYFKLNAFNCDPLGEDPGSPAVRRRSEELAAASDDELAAVIPAPGRRVDYLQRRYNHDGQEVAAVVLVGQKPRTLDEEEFRLVRLMDGVSTVAEVVAKAAGPARAGALLAKVRVLAQGGIVDLLPPARSDGQVVSVRAAHDTVGPAVLAPR